MFFKYKETKINEIMENVPEIGRWINLKIGTTVKREFKCKVCSYEDNEEFTIDFK